MRGGAGASLLDDVEEQVAMLAEGIEFGKVEKPGGVEQVRDPAGGMAQDAAEFGIDFIGQTGLRGDA